MGYIYIINCNTTGEYYIGSTRNLDQRIKGHRSLSNKTSSRGIIIRDNYCVDILEEIEDEIDLLDKEQEYMNKMSGDKLVNRQKARLTADECAKYRYEKNKQPKQCECGLYIRNNHLSRHRGSNIHAARMSETEKLLSKATV